MQKRPQIGQEGAQKPKIKEKEMPSDRSTWLQYLEGHDLRGLKCDPNWKKIANDEAVCVGNDGTECAAVVRPDWLTSADHGKQYLCAPEQAKEYMCTVECAGKSDEPRWSATLCESAGERPCASPERRAKLAKVAAGGQRLRNEKIGVADRAKGGAAERMINLRGLTCEIRDGQEVCFRVGASGEREVCPAHVTSAFLTSGADQWLCTPEAPGTHYCVVACQDGNDSVQWGAHEISWCNANPGSCPPQPELVPASEYHPQPWSHKPPPPKPCEKAARTDEPIPDVTFGILTHSTREMRTLKDTLQTYEASGLLALAKEVIVFVNQRDARIDGVLKPYAERHGKRLRIMGDKHNHGLTHALDWMAGNATEEHLLFLEKDFQLVEPVECVREQLASGVKLIREGTAHVVRYRSRDRPGRPNWAELMFKGKEDAVFKGQLNLFCNHYYWIPHPEERWPDHIWRCQDEPSVFYCSKAKYCNWTNNPTLLATAWWKTEYVKNRFQKWTRHDPYDHLEMYMNWEPGSWNDEPFVVAQGDGLFKHVDRNNFA